MNTALWTTVLGFFGIAVSIFETKKGKFLGKCARIWAKIILFCSGIKYTVKNLDNLNLSNSYIFAGNHSSGFDILLGFAGLPFWIVSIAKIELRSIFVLGTVMKIAGHIFVDRKNHEDAMESLKEASISLKKLPRSVLLYPEGTRTKDGSIQNFKPGGLLLAVETGIPIVPIYYSGTYSIIKQGPWKMNNQKLKLIIGKPIFTEKYSFDTRRDLANKVQSEVLKLSNTFRG